MTHLSEIYFPAELCATSSDGMLVRFDGEANLPHVFRINGFISFPGNPTATVEFILLHGPLGSPARSQLGIRRVSAWQLGFETGFIFATLFWL